MLAEMVAWQPPRAGRPAGSISSRSIAVSRNRLFLVGLLPRRQVGTQGWSVAVEQRDVCGALTPLQPTRPTVNERSIDVLPMPGNLICYRQRRHHRGAIDDFYRGAGRECGKELTHTRDSPFEKPQWRQSRRGGRQNNRESYARPKLFEVLQPNLRLSKVPANPQAWSVADRREGR